MIEKEFYEVGNLFKNAYRQKNFMATEAEWTVWFDCLKDLEFFLLKDVALDWVRNNKFPPTIAELRDSYHKIKFDEIHNTKHYGGERWQ